MEGIREIQVNEVSGLRELVKHLLNVRDGMVAAFHPFIHNSVVNADANERVGGFGRYDHRGGYRAIMGFIHVGAESLEFLVRILVESWCDGPSTVQIITKMLQY